jgi:hypothetical protein
LLQLLAWIAAAAEAGFDRKQSILPHVGRHRLIPNSHARCCAAKKSCDLELAPDCFNLDSV